MKTCPACKTQYSDDTLLYCLQDGTPLSGSPTDAPTAVIPEIATHINQGANRFNVPLAENKTVDHGSQVTRVSTVEKKRSRLAVFLAVAAVLIVLLFGVIGLAALVFFRNAQTAAVANNNSPIGNNNASANTPSNARPATDVGSTPGRSPLPQATPKDPGAATPPPLVSSYPSTTRLKFARGAYSTSFSGDINPNDTRTLVLACRSGQTLTANVTGGASCVSIRGGSSSMRDTTRAGDNYITVTNNCSSVTRFSVSITVL